jgi:hypothetical protein
MSNLFQIPQGPYSIIAGREVGTLYLNYDQGDGHIGTFSYLAWPNEPHEFITGAFDSDFGRITFSDFNPPDPRDPALMEWTGYAMTTAYGDAVLAGWALSHDPREGADRWGWYAMSDYVVGDFALPIPDVGSSLTSPSGTWELIVHGNWDLLVVDPPDDAGNGTGRIGTTPMIFTWDDVAQGIWFRAVPDPQDREDVHTQFSGFLGSNKQGGWVFMAGITQDYERGQVQDESGWYATRQRHYPILDTSYENNARTAYYDGPQGGTSRPIDLRNPNWPAIMMGGNTALVSSSPPWEWVPVRKPISTFGPNPHGPSLPEQQARHTFDNESELAWGDKVLSAVAGTVLTSQMSGRDLIFTHPFRGHPGDGDHLDWCIIAALDERFHPLMAITDFDVRHFAGGGLYDYDGDYRDAVDHWAAAHPDVAPLVGGMQIEIDSGLLPPQYRPRVGDRLVAFGRWIVDAGHDIFQTEVHPPALLVFARALPEVLIDRPHAADVTECTFLARPFLVGQTVSYSGDGRPLGVRGHVEAELASVATGAAYPGTKPNPNWEGIDLTVPILSGWAEGSGLAEGFKIDVTIRPPTPRFSAGDVLVVSWRLRTRSGVKVFLHDTRDGGVRVAIRTDSTYEPPEPPPPVDRPRITVDQLGPNAADIKKQLDFQIEEIRLGIGPSAAAPSWRWDIMADAVQAAVDGGALLSVYDPVELGGHGDGQTDVRVDELSPHDIPVQVAVDDSQPFALYGGLTVGWQRGGANA